MRKINRGELSDNNKYEYDTLSFQITLDLKRLRLEQNYKQQEPPTISAEGLYQVPNGKAWYQYYVTKWASVDTTPQELFNFGLKEIRRIRSEMKKIQKELGYAGKDEEFYKDLNGPHFWVTDKAALQEAFTSFQLLIFRHLASVFKKIDIPLVDIKPIPSPTKDSPPGYYENRFPKRSLEWLFIHEGIPGHHYQGGVVAHSLFKDLFWYPGFTEGWAAYAEDLGKEVGAYQNPYEYFGKWEWDLVRSARVTLDVGINYLGWSKEEALQFWKNNIPNQDGIAEREVDRIFRWPAQVLSYKVGEREFLRLREMAQKQLGSAFSLSGFHSVALAQGSIPLPVLREVVFDYLNFIRHEPSFR